MRQINLLKQIYFIVLSMVLVSPTVSKAQTLVFAQLTGNPVNTTGWNLTGATYVGDTGGDANNSNDEVILTNATDNSSGGIFYNQSIDLSTCFQWKVEFDYRIWEGSGADGIAFCFLNVPPAGFVNGGGVGIPSTSNGVFIVLDTYENGCGTNPEIQMYQGTGYNECGAGMITRNGYPGLRSSSYRTCLIEYNSGTLNVSINGTQILSGNYNANLVGYMGFTASTGGANDKHSIKNVRIFADIAEANAGPDVTICSGGTAQLGSVNNPNYTYSWSGGPNLSASNISNPTVTLTNTTGSPIVQNYTVQTTLSSSPTSCPDNDVVSVTVNPVPLIPTNAAICSGQSYDFQGQTYSNEGVYTIMTTDAQGCQTNNQLTLSVNLNLSSSVNQSICQGSSFSFNGQNYSTSGSFPVTLTSQSGCDSIVTLNLTVNPAPITQLNESICAGNTFIFGNQNLTQSGQYSQTLQTTAGCDSIINLNLIVNPTITSSQNSFICEGETVSFFGQTLSNSGVYSQTLQTISGCDSTVTMNLVVNPIPSTPLINSNSPLLCEGDNLIMSTPVQSATDYSWTGPNGFTSNSSSFTFPAFVINTGIYNLTVSQNGCISNPASSLVEILNYFSFDDFDLPNVITPDGDGINDELDIEAHFHTCLPYTLSVFNRWGNLVYSHSIDEPPFSGKTLDGKDLSDGVYTYRIKYESGEKLGFIHVVRGGN
jgi:gliding motility-associated-like protein